MGPLLPPRPGVVPAPYAAVVAPGFVRFACTNTGRQVRVWVPVPGAIPDWQYFCHGHTLGTFPAFGYTVFSGHDLQMVLHDEWQLIGNLHHARMGDMVVWHGVHPGAPQMADHSALIRTVGMAHTLQVDLHRTKLSSKNGIEPMRPSVSLADLIAVYGNAYALYRRA